MTWHAAGAKGLIINYITRRLQVSTEAMQNMKTLKLNCWEDIFLARSTIIIIVIIILVAGMSHLQDQCFLHYNFCDNSPNAKKSKEGGGGVSHYTVTFLAQLLSVKGKGCPPIGQNRLCKM